MVPETGDVLSSSKASFLATFLRGGLGPLAFLAGLGPSDPGEACEDMGVPCGESVAELGLTGDGRLIPAGKRSGGEPRPTPLRVKRSSWRLLSRPFEAIAEAENLAASNCRWYC